MSRTFELFVCTPLSTSLTRVACGMRHKRAAREIAKGGTQAERGQGRLAGAERCAECPIGAAHVRGEQPTAWPDGSAIEVRESAPMVSRESVDRDDELAARKGGERPSRSADQPAKAEPGESAPVVIEVKGEVSMPPPKMVTYNGRTQSLTQWAADPEVAALGLSYKAIADRIASGWPPELAFTRPAQRGIARTGSKPRARRLVSVPKPVEDEPIEVVGVPAPPDPPLRIYVREGEPQRDSVEATTARVVALLRTFSAAEQRRAITAAATLLGVYEEGGT